MTAARVPGKLLDYTLAGLACVIFALAMLSGLPRLKEDSSIRIATALLPPQMDSTGNGREAEIVVAALRAGGEKRPIEFHVLPFTRHWHAFKADRRFQAVTTVPADLDLDGVPSQPYVRFQNGIVYRTADFPQGLGPTPLRAVAGKRMVAFAGASVILPDVRDLAAVLPLYIERADQLSHSILYARGQVDVVVADELIFAHYTRQLEAARADDLLARSAFDPVFCATPYRLVFRDYQLRDTFDRGLIVIGADGTLGRIEERYARQAGLKKNPRAVPGCPP